MYVLAGLTLLLTLASAQLPNVQLQDVTELQHCERATATSAECIACCQSAHFTIPLEERGCKTLCPITHPSKRQLGDLFHLDEFRPCYQNMTTTEECLRCCRSAHFTLQLEEEPQCERMCPFWLDIWESEHQCARDTTTSAECITCCQSAHYRLPQEQRDCESYCPLPPHTKRRQLQDWWQYTQDFRNCLLDTATTEACLHCCRSTHFTIPEEERSCEIMCPMVGHPSG